MEEFFDIVNESGQPTGRTVSRGTAHRKGIRHRTSHVWLVRTREGRLQILLQKRSESKDSFPGCYDISSAGHIPAGSDFLESAVRELKEELGVTASEKELVFCGRRAFEFEDFFHGEPFRDRQVSNVYLAFCDADEDAFVLQADEVAEVRWFDFEECVDLVKSGEIPNCIYVEELEMVRAAADRALARERRFSLVDRAAKGDIDAAAELGIGYLDGSFGAADIGRGLKWCRYAAKHGSVRASARLRKMGY